MEKKLPETLARLIAGWPGAAPIKLMFQDEARFGRICDVRRCWAPRPVRPMCQGMLTYEYTYAYAAVDVLIRTESDPTVAALSTLLMVGAMALVWLTNRLLGLDRIAR